ncbi:cna B-type domain protein [Phocaeicola vulgatus str. 3775 SL(B) 10 (iv)]|uniref:Cna B-type domain protein n=1 Tax=Phocaeicola vulgatus str. 3775 SL(B) 10 (iv) TaxID=1339350 RepID=A0A078R612_PHOVU|nr:cna B-type domain protein [Phocaeicola vulgatus str. 3775 SR(B) 19]KDS30750.1 cna B-type domain protein [Phocaeicola vulgatus str. 3775 SL(B) 10 (iv)]
MTNEPIPYLSVFYEGKGVGSITDNDGNYKVETRKGWNKLTFSAVGYVTKVVNIIPGVTKNLNVRMRPDDIMLDEVVVKPKREKYSRKNNPAVELMKKVIAHKKNNKLSENDYYQYNKYQKITMSLNDVTPEMLEKGMYKKMPFLKDQIELCEETNKFILPISVDETASQKIYRKHPKSEKTIIKGMSSTGVNELFATGDMLSTVLKDVFTDVNIYDNDIRLLQYPFISPISSSDAISFYKFYIMDTTFVDKDKCFHLTFVPNNSQDFGFTGHLYVLADSSYTVKKCTMNLPKKSGVNFVDNMDIIQEFEQLPNGEWVLKTDDMIVEMTLMKIMQGFQIRRTTRYSDYAFDELPQQLFKRKGAEIKEADAMMRGDDFWNQYRPVPLTQTESSMDMLVKRLEQMPGFKYVIFVLKAFIENFVETGTKEHPSKVDIGPVNTMISNNYIDGLRLRMSAQTTANLNPHLFFKGYYAYGFKDHRSKYMGEVEYSFNKKEYLPREFPKNSITFSYQYDVMSPTDKFLKTDKDNVFVSFKTSTVDQMSYVRNIALKYENETQFGLKTTVEVKHSTDEPTGGLAYITNDDQKTLVPEIQTMEASLAFRYAPGETFVNTKQRRIPVSFDAPVFTLSHTAGFKGVLGGEYNYNLTEIGLYKRFWFSSWGKIDMFVKGGAQWNKVPFPLLIMPAANLSYILQRETFNLINNMEFLNDRYASLDVSWDLNGKIFNRIPLLKKLKWREAIGFKMLYGHLTDKNNPMKHPGDSELFLFPTRDGRPTSFVMDPKTPYMECSVGIHNIFKILHIDYVRRLNYLDHPDANKWGVRFMVMMTF